MREWSELKLAEVIEDRKGDFKLAKVIWSLLRWIETDEGCYLKLLGVNRSKLISFCPSLPYALIFVYFCVLSTLLHCFYLSTRFAFISVHQLFNSCFFTVVTLSVVWRLLSILPMFILPDGAGPLQRHVYSTIRLISTTPFDFCPIKLKSKKMSASLWKVKKINTHHFTTLSRDVLLCFTYLPLTDITGSYSVWHCLRRQIAWPWPAIRLAIWLYIKITSY